MSSVTSAISSVQELGQVASNIDLGTDQIKRVNSCAKVVGGLADCIQQFREGRGLKPLYHPEKAAVVCLMLGATLVITAATSAINHIL